MERFFGESIPEFGGRVLIDEDDVDTYSGMVLPEGWAFEAGERVGAARTLNRGFKAYPDEPWYAVVADDVVCKGRWDSVLSLACLPDKIAWGDDGRWGEGLCTTFFLGGDLVRRMGWISPPGFGHLFVDRVWWEIALRSGLGRYHPEIKTSHFNIHDETYFERAIRGDAGAFEELKKKGLNDYIQLALGREAAEDQGGEKGNHTWIREDQSQPFC